MMELKLEVELLKSILLMRNMELESLRNLVALYSKQLERLNGEDS